MPEAIEPLINISSEFCEILSRNNLLKSLIKSELVNQLLINVPIDENDKQKNIKVLEKNLGLKTSEEVDVFLNNNSMSKDQFEFQALYRSRVNKYSEDFNNKVEAHFLQRKEALDIVIYSLIRLEDPYQAREMYLRIIDKESDFGEIAKNYSKGIERKTRGIVGPVPLIQAHPVLVKYLKNSKPGVVQPPLKIENNFLIVRLESLETAKLDDFMREKMREELFVKYIDSEVDILCKTLLNKSIKN
tara:strand:+ start:566 stop:1300 length:735 start_codon:yes stop_codon:yes gene_type:complete